MFRGVSSTRGSKQNYVWPWPSDDGTRRFIFLNRRQQVCIPNAVWNASNNLRIHVPTSFVFSSEKYRSLTESSETVEADSETRRSFTILRYPNMPFEKMK